MQDKWITQNSDLINDKSKTQSMTKHIIHQGIKQQHTKKYFKTPIAKYLDQQTKILIINN